MTKRTQRTKRHTGKIKPGDIYEVPLGDGRTAFFVPFLEMTVEYQAYGGFFGSMPTGEDVVGNNAVSRSIYYGNIGSEGIELKEWPLVGHIGLPQGFTPPPSKFVQFEDVSARRELKFGLIPAGEHNPSWVPAEQVSGLEDADLYIGHVSASKLVRKRLDGVCRRTAVEDFKVGLEPIDVVDEIGHGIYVDRSQYSERAVPARHFASFPDKGSALAFAKQQRAKGLDYERIHKVDERYSVVLHAAPTRDYWTDQDMLLKEVAAFGGEYDGAERGPYREC